MKSEKLKVKSAIKREQSDACINYAERKQARPKVKGERLGIKEYRVEKVSGKIHAGSGMGADK